MKYISKSIHNEILRPIFILTSICLIVSACLSLTNLLTHDRIKEREAMAQNEAMASLMPDSDFKKIELIGNEECLKSDVFSFYVALKSSKTAGYVITTSAKGYGGDVRVMTALTSDKKVIGVNILSVADETPGLGQNAGKPNFYEQMKGKCENIVLVKNSAQSAKNEINAVTGATITSKAVTKAVNQALEAAEIYETNFAGEGEKK